jgi:PTS system N-acetylglucosamine-specific IIC component
MARGVEQLQKLGRALMLPIAVLPVAALLLRLGQPDMLDIAVLAAAGNAIFSSLGLVFAVGVAVGFARENHGAAGLASLVGFLVATQGAQALLAVPPDVLAGLQGAAADAAGAAWRAQQVAKLSMPIGLLTGLVAGWCYNRFGEIRLPSYLAFFGGRRFVPIATSCAGLVLAVAFGFGWPLLAQGMDGLSRGVVHAGAFGLFAYGLLNRLLIVTGLHHILNNIAWFILGDFHGVTGDLKRFFAGDPTAGDFMSGFFPVMMFGLPGACLAMYHAAPPGRRRAAGGLLLSIALTAFLTGVTEPIEFTFMFIAPVLYAVHAVLTGLSMVIMHALGVHLGFGFSAGLFDYLLNFSHAQHPLWLLPVGAAYFAVYYGLFRYGIRRLNLATPGREPQEAASPPPAADAGGVPGGGSDLAGGAGSEPGAAAFVRALGGAANLRSVDACTTRLRLEVVDSARVDGAALAALGAMGVVRPSATAAQVVLGPVADQVAGRIRRELQLSAGGAEDARAEAAAPLPAPSPAPLQQAVASLLPPEAADLWLEVLGGGGNLQSADSAAGRLLLAVRDAAAVEPLRLAALAPRGVVRTRSGEWQVLLGDQAATVAATLRARLSR